MSCSTVHKQALAQWSPDGKHIAGAAQNRLLLRDSERLQLVQVYVCVDKIERVEWASDSIHILAEVCRQGIVQIWSLQDSDWQCRIDEGLAGVARARWCPSPCHVAIICDYQLYVSVWSLEQQRCVAQILHPKYSHRGLAFSSNGRWMALLQRNSCRDSLVIVSCEAAQDTAQFSVLSEAKLDADCADLAWSPCDTSLVLWERPGRSARILSYSLRGELLAQVDDCGLMRCVMPSPSSQFFAVCGFDGRVHMLSGSAHRPMAQLVHDLKIACAEVGEDEVQLLQEEIAESNSLGNGTSRYVKIQSSVAKNGVLRSFATTAETLTVAPSADSDGMPRQGVGAACWSPDERYLATKHDGVTSAIWIWDVGRLALSAVLLHLSPVRTFSWNCSTPSSTPGDLMPKLAICTADAALFIWSPNPRESSSNAASAIGRGFVIGSPISAMRLQWHVGGQAVLLQERDRVCVVWPWDSKALGQRADSATNDFAPRAGA